MKESLVVVRSMGSGVHIGVLTDQKRQRVDLLNARRLWRWSGANTLNEVATKGVDLEYTRLSEPVPRITILDAIELIPVSGDDDAIKSLTVSRWPA